MGLTDKLRLLSAEFFAGNTTVRNELFHEIDTTDTQRVH